VSGVVSIVRAMERASAPRAPAGEAGRPAPLDADSRAWLDDLRAEGAARERAIARLHALLLRAARFETGRRRASHPHLRGDLDDIAQEAADDALLAVLARLDDFRGLSRFTTWAYKFALYHASVKVRRRAWQGREIPVEDEAWATFSTGRLGPGEAAEQAELLGAIREGIDGALTPHQRSVLVALALNEVPIDVLAERLQTTRGALYKTLHDARRKLRRHLVDAGLSPDEPREEVS
jgi:RNA polymerase sigma-70 factor (ECF subfamily)